MQEGKTAGKISISGLKRNFTERFPNSALTPILLAEPDSIGLEELIGKTGTWLAFLQRERSEKK